MFNKHILVLLLVVMLSGCSASVDTEKNNTTTKPVEEVTEDPVSKTEEKVDETVDIWTKSSMDGFSLMGREGQDYELKYEGKKVGNLMDMFEYESVSAYTLWNVVRDNGGQGYVFLEWGAGCGGCIGLEKHYIEVNVEDLSYKVHEIKLSENSGLFRRELTRNYSVLSPDHSKLAYVLLKGGPTYDEDIFDEQVMVYDFLTGEERLVSKIPSSKTVIESYGLGPALIKGAIQWSDDSKDVQVKSISKSISDEGTYNDVLNFDNYLISSENIDPWNSKVFDSYSLDLDGDGIMERAILFERKDNIGGGVFRLNQHFRVYKLMDGGWKMIKKDIASKDKNNIAVDRHIESVKVIDLGKDDNQELIIQTSVGKNSNYYIFGFNNGEYSDLAIPKGYLNKEKYLENDGDHLVFFGATADSTGVTERYNIICEGTLYGQIDYYSDDVACERFELFLRYKNGKFYPEKRHI